MSPVRTFGCHASGMALEAGSGADSGTPRAQQLNMRHPPRHLNLSHDVLIWPFRGRAPVCALFALLTFLRSQCAGTFLRAAENGDIYCEYSGIGRHVRF